METPMSPPNVPGLPSDEGLLYPPAVTRQALLARIGTAAFTSVNIGVAVFVIWFELGLSDVTNLSIALANLLIPLLVASGLFGYVTLCLWMQAAGRSLAYARFEAPPAWKVWVPWLVPIWTLFGPRQVMADLHVRVKWGSTKFLNLWWTGWLGYFVFDRVAGLPEIVGATFVVVATTSTALLVLSFGALQKLITDISASVAAPARTAQVRPRS